MIATKRLLINDLQQKILQWEGYKAPTANDRAALGLGLIEAAFPNGVFPVAAVHELVCATTEQAAAGGGFVAGALSLLLQQGNVCVWISKARRLCAPALAVFGIAPHKVIFIDTYKDKDVLWIMEEALKCTGLSAVVCEVAELDFKGSRRLQLAVEQSRVTGFVLRNAADKLGSTACAARWQVTPIPSADLDGLPGVGFLRWQVDLLKVRNGRTGSWTLEWQDGRFNSVDPLFITEERQVG
jgi:protein ImuA